jgi:formate--tetrahydrofolate ligase
VVLVGTIRALKYHGGCDLKELNKENLVALEKGIANLERHVSNVRTHYGLPCIVSMNHFTPDTPAEFALLKTKLDHLQVPVISARHWADGGAGAEDVARAVVELTATPNKGFRFVYEDEMPLWEKMKAVATKIYGASDISADTKVRAEIQRLQEAGYGHYPICVAKTQYSFSTDAQKRGAPSGHTVNVREVRLAAGAEFVVMVCGDIMTMPGLPKIPPSEHIDIDDAGKVLGLF